MKLLCLIVGHAYGPLDYDRLRVFISTGKTQTRTCRRCGFIQWWKSDRRVGH